MTGPTGHLLPATNHTLLLTDSPHQLPCNRHPNTCLRSLKRSHPQRPHIQLRQPAQSLFFILVHNHLFLYLSLYKIRNYSDINKFIFSNLTNNFRTTGHKKSSGSAAAQKVYIFIPGTVPSSGVGRSTPHCRPGVSSKVGLGGLESQRRAGRADHQSCRFLTTSMRVPGFESLNHQGPGATNGSGGWPRRRSGAWASDGL